MKRGKAFRGELVVGDEDIQLVAHGPEGDGSIVPYGADSQGIGFFGPPEIPASAPEDSEDVLEAELV